MNAGPWKSRADFEAWWKANVGAFNRLAATARIRGDVVQYPQEWERVAAAVEKFQRENPQ